MSHVIDLRDRLDCEGPCASPSDLLLSKLQIYEVNRKDLVDLTALLLDHPIAEDDGDAIDPRYLARVPADDWGMYRTLHANVRNPRATLPQLDLDPAPV